MGKSNSINGCASLSLLYVLHCGTAQRLVRGLSPEKHTALGDKRFCPLAMQHQSPVFIHKTLRNVLHNLLISPIKEHIRSEV